MGRGRDPLLPTHPIHCGPVGLGSYHTLNGNKIRKTHGEKNQLKHGVLKGEFDSFPTCLGPVPGAAEPSLGDQVEAAAGTGRYRNRQ